MDQTLFTVRDVLLLVIAALVVYVLELLFFMRRKRIGATKPADDDLDLASTRLGLLSVQAEMAELRSEVESLRASLEGLRGSAQPATPHAAAAQFAREGLTVEQVAARCGISRGEAELIVALQRQADNGHTSMEGDTDGRNG